MARKLLASMRTLTLPAVLRMKKISKYIRAGHEGKYIYCPHCHIPCLVGHFAWTALQCTNCKADVPKPEWLIR